MKPFRNVFPDSLLCGLYAKAKDNRHNLVFHTVQSRVTHGKIRKFVHSFTKRFNNIQLEEPRDRSENRYKSYRISISRFEAFRFTDITKLHQVDIQRVFNVLSKQNYAKSTLNDCKIALHGVFKLAIGNRVTDYNPMDYITVGDKPAERIQCSFVRPQKEQSCPKQDSSAFGRAICMS
jgi:hypothetical protein